MKIRGGSWGSGEEKDPIEPALKFKGIPSSKKGNHAVQRFSKLFDSVDHL
jgi:hypothetical protein